MLTQNYLFSKCYVQSSGYILLSILSCNKKTNGLIIYLDMTLCGRFGLDSQVLYHMEYVIFTNKITANILIQCTQQIPIYTTSTAHFVVKSNRLEKTSNLRAIQAEGNYVVISINTARFATRMN